MPRGVTTTVRTDISADALGTLHKLLTRHGTPDVLEAAQVFVGKTFTEQGLCYRFTSVHMDRWQRIIGVAVSV